jgi:hypothetical protein
VSANLSEEDQAEIIRYNLPFILDILERLAIEEELTFEYVKITGHFQISTEVDEFEMYVTFRGLDEDYESLADTALNIYFGGNLTVEIIDSDWEGVNMADLPDWARLTFINTQFVNRQDQVAVFNMSQVEPTTRRKATSGITGETYTAGMRKDTKRWADFETNEYGYV